MIADMGSNGAFELAQFSSPFMRVVDVGSGRVIDQNKNADTVNVKKRSMVAISSRETPQQRRECSLRDTSQIVHAPPPPPRSSSRGPDDFTVSAPLSRDRVSKMRSSYAPPTYAPPTYAPPTYAPPAYAPPAYVPPSRPYQPHRTASMLAPSVIVDASSRHALTTPRMQKVPPPAMSPLMAEANRMVGKVPLSFFFFIGTLVGMLGAMAAVIVLNDPEAPRNTNPSPAAVRQPVSIRANRLFVYPLMMTTERATAEGNNVHGRTASARLRPSSTR